MELRKHVNAAKGGRMRELLSQRAQGVKRSEIRELLKLTQQPAIISFAGGLPDPETFPVAEFAQAAQRAIQEDYRKSLQYGTTEGDKRFRQAVIEWLSQEGLRLTLEQVISTSAAQQGLDLICKVFLDPGDAVFCDLPTYLGALQAFTAHQAKIVGIPLEDDGMNLEILKEKIEETRRGGRHPKLIYLIPNFQNPSGITLSERKRRQVLEIAQEHNLLIVEDDPYGWLRYEGKAIPSIKSLDRFGRVITLISFSKLLCPGLRLGVLAASAEIIGELVKLKQPTDLCTPPFTQSLAYHYLASHDFHKRIEGLKRVYKEKRDAMLEALDQYMPAHREIHWTHPQGGFFIWMTLPEAIDSSALLKRAIASQVAFVIGSAFFVDGSGRNTLRLSFAEQKPELIREGIRRLGHVLEEALSVSVL
jgi:2-aminoadipate transaminase